MTYPEEDDAVQFFIKEVGLPEESLLRIYERIMTAFVISSEDKDFSVAEFIRSLIEECKDKKEAFFAGFFLSTVVNQWAAITDPVTFQDVCEDFVDAVERFYGRMFGGER